MAIGFDRRNLERAAAAVMESAASKNQTHVRSITRSRRVDLTDAADVQAHLMERAEDAYRRAHKNGEPIQIAQIQEIVYSPVAFVYELHNMEMHPPALTTPGVHASAVTHLAYFWAVL